MRFLCDPNFLRRLDETSPLLKKKEEKCWERKAHRITNVHASPTDRVFLRAFYKPVPHSEWCIPQDTACYKAATIKQGTG